MKSYVHAKGSYSESSSRPFLSEILSLIPDNYNKQVSPKDLRDALFSIWEGSPIKFTYIDSYPYIGLDRPDTKLKLFLGKKEVRGQAIMSVDMLNSDVDIYLYNNKMDDSEYQDFKMSILAGIDKSIWELAPTIEVKSRNGNLDISVNNRNGEILLNSNQFISINDIKWPSNKDSASMISNPSKIQNGDLSLFLVDGKFIEFKKPSFHIDNLTFTDENPTLIDIGGIKAGTTFKDVPISEIIRQILYPYLPPKIKIEFIGVGDNNSIERDHINDTNLEFRITIFRRSENLKSSIIRISNSKNTFLVKDGELFSSNGPSKFEYIESIDIESKRISVDKYNGEFSLKVSVSDTLDEVASIEESFNFVYPYFYGFGPIIDFNPSSTSILFDSLEKKIDIKSNQMIPVSGSGYFYFAFPKSYGNVRYINGIPILESFDLKNVKNIYSTSGKWGSVEYSVYVSKEEFSIVGIPQFWKFEF